MDKDPKRKAPHTPSSAAMQDQPENALELINKYGTYNIQPTADTENDYPAIAHGIPKAVREREQAARSSDGTPDKGHPYPKGKPRSDEKPLF